MRGHSRWRGQSWLNGLSCWKVKFVLASREEKHCDGLWQYLQCFQFLVCRPKTDFNCWSNIHYASIELSSKQSFDVKLFPLTSSLKSLKKSFRLWTLHVDSDIIIIHNIYFILSVRREARDGSTQNGNCFLPPTPRQHLTSFRFSVWSGRAFCRTGWALGGAHAARKFLCKIEKPPTIV